MESVTVLLVGQVQFVQQSAQILVDGGPTAATNVIASMAAFVILFLASVSGMLLCPYLLTIYSNVLMQSLLLSVNQDTVVKSVKMSVPMVTLV